MISVSAPIYQLSLEEKENAVADATSVSADYDTSNVKTIMSVQHNKYIHTILPSQFITASTET